MAPIKWNEAGLGNVHVSDGVMGYWATVPANWTACAALHAYMETADYSGAWASFEVKATMLGGVHKGDTASVTYDPGAISGIK